MLPFQNLSGDPEQDYFADGMVEEIITALSRFKSLFVIARNSSFTYKGRAVDVKQVGRELGVRYGLARCQEELGQLEEVLETVRSTGPASPSPAEGIRQGRPPASRFSRRAPRSGRRGWCGPSCA